MSTKSEFPVWATGRRKTSVARVRVVPGSGRFLINQKALNEFFKGRVSAQNEASAPLSISKSPTTYDFHISVQGGGVSGQAGAIKLGVARALVSLDPSIKGSFKKEGFLKRDPRMVERKKPGQPKARRRFQHSKR